MDSVYHGNGKVIATVVCFALSLVILIWQLLRIFLYKHNPRCVQAAFLSLCSLWCVCRVTYFCIYLGGTMSSSNSTWFYSLLFLLPVVFQFATFSLLVLFYVSIVHEDMWNQEYRKAFETAWWLVNCGVVVLCAAELVVQVLDYYSDAFELAQLGFTGMVVGVLVVLLGYYGTKLVRLTTSTLKNRLFSGMRLTRGKVLTITFLLLTIYFSRFIYDVLALLDPSFRSDVVSPNVEGGMPNQAFYLMLLWEILPILIVVTVFRVPSSAGLGFDRQGVFPDEENPPLLRAETGPRRSHSQHHRYHHTPHTPHTSTMVDTTMRPSHSNDGLFNDEKRYDSDGEGVPVSGPVRSLHFVFGGEFSPGMPSSVVDQAGRALRDGDETMLPEPFQTTTENSAGPAPVTMWGRRSSSHGRSQSLHQVVASDSLPDPPSLLEDDRRTSMKPGSSVGGLEPLRLPAVPE